MRKRLRFYTIFLIICVLLLVPYAVQATEVTENTEESTEENTEDTALEFVKKTKSIKAGKTYQFTVNKEGVTWSVGNKKIASISKSGLLTAKRYGKTHVYAKLGSEKVSVLIKVKPKKVIGIDAGHQSRADLGLEANGPGSSVKKIKVSGGTMGVSTRVYEYQLALIVAKQLKTKLEDRGYQVVMTRTSNNVKISNKERAQLINKSGADILIRIHADGSDYSSMRGASVLCTSKSNSYVKGLYKKSRRLSEAVIDSYCSATGIKNNGVSLRDDLTGSNWSKIPTTLIELGFMTNPAEDRFMNSEKGIKKMVKGIANGVDAYFGN